MQGWRETPEEKAARELRGRREYADWLRGFPWTHWVTLTVRGRWSVGRLRRAFDDEFVRFATKAAQGPVPYAYCIEGGALGDQAHIHALLGCTSMIRSARFVSAWGHGRSTVAVYDPRGGAPNYLAKGIDGGALDYGAHNLRRFGGDAPACAA